MSPKLNEKMTDGLNVTSTTGLSASDHQELVGALREHVQIGDCRQTLFKSDADVPAFIQVFGSVLAWLPLSALATAFLARLGQHAADDVWKNKELIAAALNDKRQAALRGIVRAIARARDAAEQKPDIIIGLDIPEDYLGTALTIDADSEEEMAVVLSRFVVKIEAIATTMQEEIENDRVPLGRARVTLKEDGEVRIEWTDRNLQNHSRMIK